MGSHGRFSVERRHSHICDFDRLCWLLCGGFETVGWDTCWEAPPPAPTVQEWGKHGLNEDRVGGIKKAGTGEVLSMAAF